MTDDSPELLTRVAEHWATTTGGHSAVRSVEPLGGGFANAVARITLADGRTAVAKVAPPPTAGLTHERELLRTEGFALRALGRADAPQPRLLAEFALDGREAIVVTVLPGVQGVDGVAPSEIGRVLAALHRVGADLEAAGGVFGYPFREELQAASAREAYVVLVDAVLDDARRFGVVLPLEPRVLRGRLAAASVAFDELTQPTLVHFDLWDGNLLVDGERITGIIDHERSMWADPTADFASRALFQPVPEAIDADARIPRRVSRGGGARTTAGCPRAHARAPLGRVPRAHHGRRGRAARIRRRVVRRARREGARLARRDCGRARLTNAQTGARRCATRSTARRPGSGPRGATRRPGAGAARGVLRMTRA